MTPPRDLHDKDALIAARMARIEALVAGNEALVAENAALAARVAELEVKLGLPPKTPDNSSVPPSKGQKPSGASAPKAKAKPHRGAHRPLHPNPTAKRAVLAATCKGCGADVSGMTQIVCEERPRRNPPDRAGRHAGVAAWRRVPLLLQTLQGRAAGGIGAGIAVRAEPARLCHLSALGPGPSAGAAVHGAGGPVRARHQRGRAGQHPRCESQGLFGADAPDQGAAAGGHDAGLG